MEKTINTLDEHLKKNRLIIGTIKADGQQATVDEHGVVSGGSAESRKKLLAQISGSTEANPDPGMEKILKK